MTDRADAWAPDARDLEDAPSTFTSFAQPRSMKRRILFVTTEIADYVKVGGLGEVSAALPRALAGEFEVRVLLPGYPEVVAQHPSLEVVAECPAFASLPAARLARARTADGLDLYILLNPELYERDGTPYGDARGVDWSDNDIRFGRLCSAAAALALGEADPAWSAHLVHVNDWPSAMTAAYLRWRGAHTPTVLTIHNLAYQGLFPRARLGDLGVPEAAFQIDGVEFYDKLSFLKAGLVYSDHITTVSGNYAREIMTEQHGCGLEGLLRRRAAEGRLSGIVNGIDDGWDAATDPNLVANFEAGDWRARRLNTAAVRNEFGLAVSKGPLFGVVSRLVHQKGMDFVVEAADAIAENGGQLVVMGRGERAVEDALGEAFARRPDALALRVDYDEAHARRIFAGSDFLLMPSRFEPCGLSQMFAQKFGSLPIAHRTGGLADTIEDGATGFLFSPLTSDNLKGAIRRALGAFASRGLMAKMRRRAMAKSFSWRDSASTYGSLYLRGIGNR